ncbi:MAG: transporter related [Verrucomicrobiales bacterium]|nr:transporter related [Verrucomicrobiales bacterium]
MKTEAPVIEMQNVSIVSPQEADVAQVENVNWRVQRGEFWIIGGSHGSGKSNLLSTAAGLQNPLRGKVTLFGRDASGTREKELEEERRRIGLVFQSGGRNLSRLTIAENVALPLRYHGNLSEAEVEHELRRILEPMELIPMAKSMSKTVSLGWQQRTALARALTLKPEVLLLDKPLSSVEARHRRWWLEFLPKLFSGSALEDQPAMTVALVTDDVEPWINIGTHFAVLKKNGWQFLGNRAELQRDEKQLRELWADELIF